MQVAGGVFLYDELKGRTAPRLGSCRAPFWFRRRREVAFGLVSIKDWAHE